MLRHRRTIQPSAVGEDHTVINGDPPAIDPTYLVMSIMIIIIAMAVATVTVLIAIQANRREIRRVRRERNPEYWRMYARTCASRADSPQPVPDID